MQVNHLNSINAATSSSLSSLSSRRGRCRCRGGRCGGRRRSRCRIVVDVIVVGVEVVLRDYAKAKWEPPTKQRSEEMNRANGSIFLQVSSNLVSFGSTSL